MKPKGPARPPDEDPADAWARVQREASAAVRGVDADIEELGDTSKTIAGAEQAGSQDAPSNEILDLVNASLMAAPERADLWMMRFEVQKTLGLRDEFARALVEGWSNPRLGRSIDWIQVGQMWSVLAPGEPAPQGIKLPTAATLEPAAPAPASEPLAASGAQPQTRRFSDTAMKLAARELGVLGKAYTALRSRPDFVERFTGKIGPLIRRPTPLHFAAQISRNWGGKARIYLKREDLRKVTAEAEYALAQAWLGQQLGRSNLITGNDVDGHSLGLAIAAQRFRQKCTVTMRRRELESKQELVDRLRKLGVAIEVPEDPSRDAEDPRVHALRLWTRSMGTAHLALSLGWGPGPYPSMVNDFQSLVGREVDSQVKSNAGGADALTLVASVGSESDAIGFVLPFLNEPDVELVFAEPDPGGVASWKPSKRLKLYNGARREHCWLHATGRITHVPIPDTQAVSMQQQVGTLEGIQLSLEDARSMALAALLAPRSTEPHNYVVLAG